MLQQVPISPNAGLGGPIILIILSRTVSFDWRSALTQFRFSSPARPAAYNNNEFLAPILISFMAFENLQLCSEKWCV